MKALMLALAACSWFDQAEPERPRKGGKARVEITAKGMEAPRTVVFAVLDTVRADHTSICGYGRPTTPVLQDPLKRGAAHSCRAYSPAPWTHPSHASFFTGKPVANTARSG